MTPRILKASSAIISVPFAHLVNKSISTGVFPNDLKFAELSPIFKKDDAMSRGNFRPVSILPCISKIFESIYSKQLSEYFDDLLSVLLSAFRKGYSCETVLTRLIEDWKSLLDKHKIIGAMMLDLSKAFDCISHRLLIAKLKAYGVDDTVCNLIKSYLSNRLQRVKIGQSRSSWLHILKGVPQGSIIGPLLFNIFTNDILYLLENMYNYADDNTISCFGETVQEVKCKVEKSTSVAMQWFKDNHMQANAHKFQAMLMGLKEPSDIHFEVGECAIHPSDSVKLLGVDIDNKLNFNEHISNLCNKAARQLHAFKRFAKFLDIKTKAVVFNSFILSNFNYCSLVWHHCGTENTHKIEKVQERGLRIIYNDHDSTYAELLAKSNRQLLYISRIKKVALHVYRSTNKHGPPLLWDMYTPNDTGYNLRHGQRLVQPKVNTTKYGLNSLRYDGASIWNSLPSDIKSAVDANHFKTILKSWSGPSCRCGFCILCKF